LIKAKINGVSGNFILDTGASNSCVGFESIELFLLTAEASRQSFRCREPQECLHKLHQIISYNLEFGRFIIRFSDFDLSHVNEALIQHKSKPVHGIIGADVLLKGKAIVDYYNHYLYLLKYNSE
jgi:hypothetical protein